MKASALRARYWRIVFFFARVTAGFIWWEVVLGRLGLRRLSNRTRSARNRRTAVRFRALAISMGGLMIKVGQFMTVTLSCDHRAVDGALGAELLAAFKALIETPVMMLA